MDFNVRTSTSVTHSHLYIFHEIYWPLGLSQSIQNIFKKPLYHICMLHVFDNTFTYVRTCCLVDLEFGEWVSQADGSKLRDIKYTLSLNYSFGPKFSPSTEHQVW